MKDLYLNETRVAPEKLDTFASLSQLISKVIQIKRLKMLEVWKPVVGYEGLYEVSSLGEVRSLDRYVRSRGQGKRFRGGILLKQGLRNKYLRVSLGRGVGIPVGESVHVIVLTAFAGPRPKGHHGSHLNGNNEDNRISNLCWESPSANCLRKKDHGTHHTFKGEESNLAKLRTQQVKDIRSLFAEGRLMQVDIAKVYGMSKNCINLIVRNKTWKHI